MKSIKSLTGHIVRGRLNSAGSLPATHRAELFSTTTNRSHPSVQEGSSASRASRFPTKRPFSSPFVARGPTDVVQSEIVFSVILFDSVRGNRLLASALPRSSSTDAAERLMGHGRPPAPSHAKTRACRSSLNVTPLARIPFVHILCVNFSPSSRQQRLVTLIVQAIVLLSHLRLGDHPRS